MYYRVQQRLNEWWDCRPCHRLRQASRRHYPRCHGRRRRAQRCTGTARRASRLGARWVHPLPQPQLRLSPGILSDFAVRQIPQQQRLQSGGCAAARSLSPHVVPPHDLHSDIIDIMFRKRSAVLLGAQVGHITVTAPTALEARRRLAAIDPAAADALASSSSSASAHPPKVPPPVTLPRVHRTIICLCYSVSASIRSGS